MMSWTYDEIAEKSVIILKDYYVETRHSVTPSRSWMIAINRKTQQVVTEMARPRKHMRFWSTDDVIIYLWQRFYENKTSEDVEDKDDFFSWTFVKDLSRMKSEGTFPALVYGFTDVTKEPDVTFVIDKNNYLYGGKRIEMLDPKGRVVDNYLCLPESELLRRKYTIINLATAEKKWIFELSDDEKRDNEKFLNFERNFKKTIDKLLDVCQNGPDVLGKKKELLMGVNVNES